MGRRPLNTHGTTTGTRPRSGRCGVICRRAPEAQAAYQSGYNGGLTSRPPCRQPGRHRRGRRHLLGRPGHDRQRLGGRDLPALRRHRRATNVTAWMQANVRSCASTSCAVVSTVYPNQSYPANCWKTGQVVTDEGYTSDKWIELALNAGGVGCVSGIYLKGDATGGVTRRVRHLSRLRTGRSPQQRAGVFQSPGTARFVAAHRGEEDENHEAEVYGKNRSRRRRRC
ncbi:hypothetical protein ACRAWF_17225 [Streptomyces sp. L7]